jgi:hypothetical protein
MIPGSPLARRPGMTAEKIPPFHAVQRESARCTRPGQESYRSSACSAFN